MEYTDEQLDARESIAALAVERALTDDEREAFTRNCLTGSYGGATPADWIAVAAEYDRFLRIVEPWSDEHFERLLPAIATQHELPERAAARVITYALYASIGISAADLDTLNRTPEELAHAAAGLMRRSDTEG